MSDTLIAIVRPKRAWTVSEWADFVYGLHYRGLTAWDIGGVGGAVLEVRPQRPAVAGWRWPDA